MIFTPGEKTPSWVPIWDKFYFSFWLCVDLDPQAIITRYKLEDIGIRLNILDDEGLCKGLNYFRLLHQQPHKCGLQASKRNLGIEGLE